MSHSALPAFPHTVEMLQYGAEGMYLRDYFAAQAMQSLILNGDTLSPEVPLSRRAYEIADAMMDAREK